MTDRQEIADARRQGAEDMRRRAAEVALAAAETMGRYALLEPENSPSRDRLNARSRMATDIAAAILALPLTEASDGE